MGRHLSRLVRTEPFVLLVAFLLLVTSLGALANRGTDPSGRLMSGTAEAAQKFGTYRFSTSQQYSGSTGKYTRYAAGVRLIGAVDIKAGVTRFDTVIRLGRINAKCTYLTIGDDLYVSVHPSRRNAIGASWLRAKANGYLAAAQLQGFRPDELNERAAEYFEDLHRDGTAVIRGADTTRYTGEINAAALTADDTRMRTVAKLDRTLPVTIYIDRDGLLRRVTIDISAAQQFKVTFTTDLFDYGKPVSISRPPPDSVRQGDAQQFGVACYPTRFTAPQSVPGANITP